jgi:hypothetical protein
MNLIIVVIRNRISANKLFRISPQNFIDIWKYADTKSGG